MSSAEWEPGPSIVMPKRPESVKWELMAEAESTNSYCCIRLVMARQYMPLPGPPELKAVALPMSVDGSLKCALAVRRDEDTPLQRSFVRSRIYEKNR